ncbi:LysR family transcriptional regulator [Marinospirillum perlucidum]|uniref:LysR family transcriptional regulator n=1 Tax=Marinospirillum perlucidum TaxID=1982602 RepID=UPI000DF35685|nr:LysR family transcriptional regulator [Marinospirillum perlucidum]
MNKISWQAWQMFLQLVRSGSLNRAAEKLGWSQPTLSRQLRQLEKQLGQTLFDRSTQGLRPTAFALSLMESCEEMENLALQLERRVSGLDQALTGRIRLSVNELLAQYYLPALLPGFMDSYPQLSLEVEVNNRASSLDRRDADVALRMFVPRQPDLVARKLFELPLGFYASGSYLDRVGQPSSVEDLLRLRLLGYDRDQQLVAKAAELGWSLGNEDFLLRTDFQPLHLELACQGGGVVITHASLAESRGLKVVEVDLPLPSLPVYLCCHRDVEHNRRIRVLMDFLAEHLSPHLVR